MATYRLSGLTIFLILLAVLLVAYLLNYTWESFKCGCTETFGGLTDYGEAVPGYSENEKKIVEVYDNLYFDPVNRNIVEPLSDSKLKITNRNNQLTEHSFAQSTKKVWSAGIGSWTDISSAGTLLTSLTDPQTIETGTIFKDMVGNDQLLAVDVSGTTIQEARTYNLSDILDISGVDKIMTESETRDTFVRQGLPRDSGTYKLYWRGYENDNYIVPAKSGTMTNFIYIGNVSQGNVPTKAILHVPIQGTSVTFIHVMDFTKRERNGEHHQMWYFNGDTMERKDIMKQIKDSGTTEYSLINGTNLMFEKTYDTEMSQLTSGDFVIETEHLKNSESPAVKIVCRKKETTGYSSFRALITFDSNQRPVLGKIETSSGADSEDSSYDEDDSEKSETEKKWEQYRDLQASLFGPFSGGYTYYGQYDGSPYSDYLLKTEVVPPVCPSCPTYTSKSTSSEVSSDELKDSLVKEFGSGVDQFLRDGADGATNIARDAAGGAYDVAKETASGTVQVAKDTVSGTGEFVQSSASGVGEYAKDAAGGAYSAASEVAAGTVGIGREIVGGAYDAASGVAGGVYNAGASVAGGAYNVGAGAVNALGQVIPNYGAPGAGGASGTVPNAAMGGHQNSYGGGYQNPQQPATAGQDPYSYFGSVPPRYGGCNYMPRTADFSSFGK